MRLLKYTMPTVFILISIGISGYFVHISATSRSLTALEGTLLQIFTLASGLLGSYLIGKQSTEELSLSRLRSSGQSALRRLWTLYLSLSRVAQLIADEDASIDASSKLLAIKEVVITQLLTADAAVEDWKDIVPNWEPFPPSQSVAKLDVSFNEGRESLHD